MAGSFRINGEGYEWRGRVPDACPRCHCDLHSLKPKSPHFWRVEEEGTEGVDLVFVCPNHECDRLFIASYCLAQRTEPDPKEELGRGRLDLLEVHPERPDVGPMVEAVRRVSPSFPAIYSEALQAKALGLQQICGPGFRKAFEFLVRDYAKSLTAAKEHPTVEKMRASAVVKEYITDPRIQSLAKRTLWIGNDETHYLRMWKDRDVDDLVKLIEATAHYMEIERLSQEYIDEMPEKN